MRAMLKRTLAVSLFTLAALPSVASAGIFPGQKPVIVMARVFRFVPGSWARYTVLDKTTNESYRMTVSVLDRRKVDGRVWARLEVAVRCEGELGVVTRVLAQETGDGPGTLQSAVVQLEGRPPFAVPGGLLKPGPDDPRVAPIAWVELTRTVAETAICCKGRLFRAWRVEARMPDGTAATALVSGEIPPTAISELDTAALHLSADDWGLGARTGIRGTPVPFLSWVLDQASAGIFSRGAKSP